MVQRLLASAAVGAFLFAGVASADDGWNRRGHGWDRGYDSHWDRGRRDYRHHDDNDNDAALLIGGAIVGLAVGTLIANSNNSDGARYNDPGYGYGYAEPSYSYASPPPSYGYATPAPSYGYATPAPGGFTSPNTGVTYANMGVPCRQAREGRTATGAVIGGVIGGLIGNGVAADGVRGEGTAVGAVLGSTIGGSIGNSTAECGGAPSAGYQQTGYTYQDYTGGQYGGQYGGQPYGDPYGGLGSNAPYSEPYTEEYRWEDELYGGPESGSSYSGPAAQECQQVTRVTSLPDGREIHEPVEVCREAHYGEWSARN